jgi:hypothetical protein
MGRRFITARDIDDLFDRGERELRIEATTVLTDVARERARERGVTVTAASAGTAPGDRPPSGSGPSGATASRPGGGDPAAVRAPSAEVAPAVAATAPGEDGPSRRQLRAAVRAAVIAEFGTTPEGIDAAIGRVFDRFGVTD